MKHSEKDKLEQFFQNSLENYGENPSTDFWSKMEGRIPPPPPVLPPPFWKKYGLFLALFLIAGLVYLIGFQNVKYAESLADINKTIELQDQTIDEIKKEFNQVQNQFLEKSEIEETFENQIQKSNSKNQEVSQQYIYNFKNDRNNLSSSNKKDELVAGSGNYNAAANIITRQDSSALKTKTPKGFSQKEIILIKKSGSILSSVDAVENIPSIFLLADFSKKEKLDLPKDGLIKFEKDRNPKRGFEFFGGFHKIYPNIKIGNTSLDFDNPLNRESNYGMLLSFPMHKNWAIQFGFGFGESHRSLAIENNIGYSASEIEISDNIVRTGYNFYLKTNYNGTVGFRTFVDNHLQNDGSDIQAGESFTAEINIKKRQKYLMVPFYIKHYLNKKTTRLKWSVKMGIVQRLAYFDNEIALVNLSNFSHPRLQFSHINMISINDKQVKKYKTELVFGAGMEYLFAKNWILIVEPTFKQSTTLEGKITPYTVGLYTGVRWNFK